MEDNRPAKMKLNELNGKEWVKSTKSWFVVNPPSRNRAQMQHPAKFPESLVARFVNFFTQPGAWVLDPFAGVGSTLVACRTLERNSLGVELNPDFVDVGKAAIQNAKGSGEQLLVTGDSMDIAALIETQYGEEVPPFQYL
ncbi:MAG: DNA methyltransferase, partial [Candidatus Thorarchaeota archaeon]